MFPLLTTQTFFSALSLSLIYLITRTIYRLYFHPLASFPGPRLAAATSLYNACYDIFGTGLVKHYPALHAKYGNIVRIMPNEVHVADLEGYNQIHRVGTPFNRIWHDNPFLTGSLQSLTTLPETKKRKEFISPFFSKTAISRVEASLHGAKVTQFLATLAAADNSVVNFAQAFRCLTCDVVMDYCFHTDLNALASRGFRNETIETFMQGFDMAIVATFFPAFFALVGKLIDACSEPTRKKYFPGVYGFESMQTKAREGVEDALARAANGEESTGTMFDAMARPDGGKGQEKVCKKDMVADGCLMIAAGTDTTAHALCTVLWYVTQDRQVSDKLLAELKRNVGMDEIVGSATLEGQGFEYLRAVVKEGLRLSYGVPGRIIRRVPREGARFREVWVPGGTIITSSIYMQNMDPTTFPDPHRFDPERWMCDAETYKLRDKQMVSYSRGSRSCVGMNLANATLYLTVAHLFRRFDITTTGHTTAQDMEWRDRFVPATKGMIKGMVKLRTA